MIINEHKEKLNQAISDLVGEAMMSHRVTWEEIVDVLSHRLVSAILANKAVLEIGAKLTEQTGEKFFADTTVELIIGKSGGSA